MAGRRVRITVGDAELEADWRDTETADRIYEALPLSARGSYWGGEIYFEIRVDADIEDGASDVVEPGSVAFWPAGNCLCVFWGPTPASHGDECRAASAVNVVGRVEDVEALTGLTGHAVTVEAI